MAAAWARGAAASAALGAIVGFVAGDGQVEQGAGWDVELEATGAAIDYGARGYGQAAGLFDYADGFARGAARGPDVFDDEDTLTRNNFKAAAKGHLAGAIAFDEDGADAEGAGDFVADDYAAQRRRSDTDRLEIGEFLGQGAAELLGIARMLEHQGTLNIGGAM